MSKRTEQKIQRLKEQMMQLGPVHPGRITKQYNVCGTPGCRCKAEHNPRKHGPYHYLSYTFGGKGRTVFVPNEQLAEMQRRTRAYVKLKELIGKLTEAYIQLAKEQVLPVNRTKRRTAESNERRKGGRQ
jgi:hypothetical protein